MVNSHARKQYLQIFIGTTFLIFTLRLFYLQVISTEFSSKADNNVIRKLIIQPSRGIIYDRHGKIYVTNTPIFDLLIVPNELQIQDTNVLASILKLDKNTIIQRIEAARKFSKFKPSVLEKQINFDVYYALEEHLWKFKGIYPVVRITRDYLSPVGANFLGYIREVNEKDILASNGYYKQGDLIGTTGLERFFEEQLRGKKGVKMVMEDVHGRAVGVFANGSYDTIPVKGEDIVISVDTELQKLGEELMQNKIGSIVAIEPATGEILAFVSAPCYNPQLLSGLSFDENWKKLQRDSLKPLYNRPLMANYPPGSIFKTLNSLLTLQEGTLKPQTIYGCQRGFARNKGRPRCHVHPTPLNVSGAVQYSCNAFFAGAYVDFLNADKFDSIPQAYNVWRNYMSQFGIGHRVGVDLPNESPGFIPQTSFYDKWYGKKRWKAMNIVSNGIGQGEVALTPLQMANAVCIIANRGYYIRPHFFKNYFNKKAPPRKPEDSVAVPIDTAHFNLVIDAMERVVNPSSLAYTQGISICGKTGTAENPHGRDHSVFFAFAPKDKPKIAIAVFIENAGHGSQWAAPVAGLMIEKYLTGNIATTARYKRIIDADLIKYRHLPSPPPGGGVATPSPTPNQPETPADVDPAPDPPALPIPTQTVPPEE